MAELSYVYKIIRPDTGQFYIGCRSCANDPTADGNYMGGGTWAKKMRKANLVLAKSIIQTFDNYDAARDFESSEINRNRDDKLCMNIQCKSAHKTGMSRAERLALDAKRGIERVTFEAPIEMMKVIRSRADTLGLSMADIIRMLLKKGLAA